MCNFLFFYFSIFHLYAAKRQAKKTNDSATVTCENAFTLLICDPKPARVVESKSRIGTILKTFASGSVYSEPSFQAADRARYEKLDRKLSKDFSRAPG